MDLGNGGRRKGEQTRKRKKRRRKKRMRKVAVGREYTEWNCLPNSKEKMKRERVTLKMVSSLLSYKKITDF